MKFITSDFANPVEADVDEPRFMRHVINAGFRRDRGKRDGA